MFCMYCGSEIADGSKFCPNCGKMKQDMNDSKINNDTMNIASNIEENTSSNDYEPLVMAEIPKYQREVTNESVNQINDSQTVRTQNTNQKIAKPKKKNAVVPIVIGALIVAILLIVAIAYVGSKVVTGLLASGGSGLTIITNNSSATPDPFSGTEPEETPEPALVSDPASAEETLTTKVLSDDVEAVLNNLASDYNKVYWGVEYQMEENPGIVISVTPFNYFSVNGLIVGITNLYDQACDVYGKGYLLDKDGNEIGELYAYAGALAPGNTYITNAIPNTDNYEAVPNGSIRWVEFTVSEPYYESGKWEADWTMNGQPSSGEVDVMLEMTNTSEEDAQIGLVSALLLDENGFVTAFGTQYKLDEVKKNDKISISVPIFGDEELLAKSRDAAIFCNPTYEKK